MMKAIALSLLVCSIAVAEGTLLANGRYNADSSNPNKPDCAFTVDTAGTHIVDCNGDEWFAEPYGQNCWRYRKADDPEELAYVYGQPTPGNPKPYKTTTPGGALIDEGVVYKA